MLTRGEWFGSAALNALLLDIAEGAFAPLRAPRSIIPSHDGSIPLDAITVKTPMAPHT
jgi:hypothetical protein